MAISLELAISAIKAGRKAEGRQLLNLLIQQNPNDEMAWLWMSSVVSTDEQRARCLYHVLSIDPTSKLAQRGLDLLGIVVSDSRPVQIPRDSQPIHIPKPSQGVVAPPVQPQQSVKAEAKIDSQSQDSQSEAGPTNERRPFLIDPKTITRELPFVPVNPPFKEGQEKIQASPAILALKVDESDEPEKTEAGSESVVSILAGVEENSTESVKAQKTEAKPDKVAQDLPEEQKEHIATPLVVAAVTTQKTVNTSVEQEASVIEAVTTTSVTQESLATVIPVPELAEAENSVQQVKDEKLPLAQSGVVVEAVPVLQPVQAEAEALVSQPEIVADDEGLVRKEAGEVSQQSPAQPVETPSEQVPVAQTAETQKVPPSEVIAETAHLNGTSASPDTETGEQVSVSEKSAVAAGAMAAGAMAAGVAMASAPDQQSQSQPPANGALNNRQSPQSPSLPQTGNNGMMPPDGPMETRPSQPVFVNYVDPNMGVPQGGQIAYYPAQYSPTGQTGVMVPLNNPQYPPAQQPPPHSNATMGMSGPPSHGYHRPPSEPIQVIQTGAMPYGQPFQPPQGMALHSNSTMLMPAMTEEEARTRLATGHAIPTASAAAMPLQTATGWPVQNNFGLMAGYPTESESAFEDEDEDGDEINILAVIIFGTLSITALGGLGMLVLLIITTPTA